MTSDFHGETQSGVPRRFRNRPFEVRLPGLSSCPHSRCYAEVPLGPAKLPIESQLNRSLYPRSPDGIFPAPCLLDKLSSPEITALAYLPISEAGARRLMRCSSSSFQVLPPSRDFSPWNTNESGLITLKDHLIRAPSLSTPLST